jgi:hypothetical protein
MRLGRNVGRAAANQAIHKRGKKKDNQKKLAVKELSDDSKSTVESFSKKNAAGSKDNKKKLRFAKLKTATKGKGGSSNMLGQIANLAQDTRKSQVPNQAEEDFLEIVRTGGVAAIIETMRSEADYAWVAELGSRTLINILRFHHEVYGDSHVDDDGNEVENPSEIMFETGGFQLLTKLLLVFRDNDIVAEALAALVGALSRFEDVNCERIAVLGGIQVVVVKAYLKHTQEFDFAVVTRHCSTS